MFKLYNYRLNELENLARTWTSSYLPCGHVLIIRALTIASPRKAKKNISFTLCNSFLFEIKRKCSI